MLRAWRDRALRQTGDLVGESMIHVPMMCLICTNYQHNVPKGGIGGKAPVILGQLRRWDVFGASLIDLRKLMSVYYHRLFIEVADHSVRGI
jgi:hypothetical protein